MLSRDLTYHDLGADHFVERLGARGKAKRASRLIDQLH
jgi:hypothetical protein